MGKKYTTFLTLFTVICITLTGCERENEQTANQGRLNLKLAVDTGQRKNLRDFIFKHII